MTYEEYMNKTLEERKSYIDIISPCEFTYGRQKTKKLLSEFLGISIPKGRVLMCHACNNTNCSNIHHVYFGTDYENIVIDGKAFGTFKNVHELTLAKYGEEETKKIKAKGDKSKGGKANKNIPKSDEHKRKIAEAITEWHRKRKSDLV